MDVTERELKILVSADGASAFEEWYRGIRDRPTRLRIRARLARVRSGNFGDHKIFSGGVGELRLDFGPGYRVYFAQDGLTIIFLLAGDDKSTQIVDAQSARRLWGRTKMILKDFNETFAYELQDPEFVKGYLQACLEHETLDAFLVALREVVKENGGMTKLAAEASLGRESLYKTLSAQGNPEFRTLSAVLAALGLRFSVVRADVADAPKEAQEEALQAA